MTNDEERAVSDEPPQPPRDMSTEDVARRPRFNVRSPLVLGAVAVLVLLIGTVALLVAVGSGEGIALVRAKKAPPPPPPPPAPPRARIASVTVTGDLSPERVTAALLPVQPALDRCAAASPGQHIMLRDVVVGADGAVAPIPRSGRVYGDCVAGALQAARFDPPVAPDVSLDIHVAADAGKGDDRPFLDASRIVAAAPRDHGHVGGAPSPEPMRAEER